VKHISTGSILLGEMLKKPNYFGLYPSSGFYVNTATCPKLVLCMSALQSTFLRSITEISDRITIQLKKLELIK